MTLEQKAKAEYDKKYYQKNKVRRGKKYRQNNSKTIRKTQAKWRAENPDYWQEWRPKYYAANPEKREALSERHRRWLKDNPDKTALYRLNREDQYLDAILPGTDHKKIKKIYEQRDEIQKKTGDRYHVDHIIPLSIGGAHHQDNLRIVTALENMKKKDKYVPELGGVWANNKLARKTKKKLDIE
jgi:5-methylcytosine-specific restriction endonuclease McrA